MNEKKSRVDFDNEQYYTVPFVTVRRGLDEDAAESPVSLFQIKAELAGLSLHIEDLIVREEAVRSEVIEARNALGNELREGQARTADEFAEIKDTLTGELVEKLADFDKRIISRQDAVNARMAKLSSDLSMLEAVLDGKIEGVRGAVQSSSAGIAEAVRGSISTSGASLHADLVTEITDIGRMIVKKVREVLQVSSGEAQGELTGMPSGDIASRLERIEMKLASLPEGGAKSVLASAEAMEILERVEESVKSLSKIDKEYPDAPAMNELLAVVDAFDRATEFVNESVKAKYRSAFEGLLGIRDLLLKYLRKYELEPMAVSGKFDPKIHRAMGVTDDIDFEDGEIVRVLSAGYMHKGKVFRFAEVLVNRRA